jgi:hypothetical protein
VENKSSRIIFKNLLFDGPSYTPPSDQNLLENHTRTPTGKNAVGIYNLVFGKRNIDILLTLVPQQHLPKTFFEIFVTEAYK